MDIAVRETKCRLKVVSNSVAEKVGSCESIFFFFQAEDGIRDISVTGVQTCALPIYRRAGF